MDQDDITAHREPESGAMCAEAEVEVVEVEAVERFAVERNRRRHLAAHRHEDAVERLDAGDDQRPAAQHHRRVAAVLGIGRRNEREHVRIAGGGPLARDETRRAGNADQVVVVEVAVDARREIGVRISMSS